MKNLDGEFRKGCLASICFLVSYVYHPPAFWALASILFVVSTVCIAYWNKGSSVFSISTQLADLSAVKQGVPKVAANHTKFNLH